MVESSARRFFLGGVSYYLIFAFLFGYVKGQLPVLLQEFLVLFVLQIRQLVEIFPF